MQSTQRGAPSPPEPTSHERIPTACAASCITKVDLRLSPIPEFAAIFFGNGDLPAQERDVELLRQGRVRPTCNCWSMGA